MALDARVEVRLTLERMQAQMLQFVRGEIMPALEGRIREIVADFDVDALVKEAVRAEYDATLRRLVQQRVQAEVWKHQERLEALVEREIRKVKGEPA